MDPNFKFNLRTLNIAVFISIYVTCSLYTICTGDLEVVWQCMVFLGTGAQGCVKFPIPLLYAKEGYATLKKIEGMYHNIQQQGRSSLEHKMLETCVYVCDKVFSVYLVLFACGFLVTVSYPLIMLFVFDEKVLIITMFIPGVDPFGQYGFIAHEICHAIMALILCTGSPAGDFYFMFNVAHIYVFVEFLRYRIGRFNDWLLATQNQPRDRDWHENSKRLLDEILIEHQILLDFMELLDEMFFVPIAVHIGTSTVALGIGLFFTMTTTWYVAYMLSLIALFQLFVYSILGTIVKAKNDDLLIYVHDILWYLLPCTEQKKMIMLLKRCQKPKEFTIAGMAPLNLDTLVKILKTIYSFFMMLLNSL